VTVRYGRGTVLDAVDLRLPPGQIIALAGSNGAGKTTLLKVLAGLLRPASGSVLLDGAGLTHQHLGPDDLLGVFTPAGFHDWLPAHRNLEVFAGLSRRPPRIEPLAAMAALGVERSPTRAGRLSLGQRQRLALSMVQMFQPRFVLLDEPFTGLDILGIDLLCRLAHEWAEAGSGVLIASHQLQPLDGLAESLVVLHQGRIHGHPVDSSQPLAAQFRSVIESRTP
jgi:ABC-2 type transport system ATP-binding protein